MAVLSNQCSTVSTGVCQSAPAEFRRRLGVGAVSPGGHIVDGRQLSTAPVLGLGFPFPPRPSKSPPVPLPVRLPAPSQSAENLKRSGLGGMPGVVAVT